MDLEKSRRRDMFGCNFVNVPQREPNKESLVRWMYDNSDVEDFS